MGVSVPHMPDQLATSGEAGLAIFAPMGLGPRVSVDMVVQTGQGLETSLTDRALVRSLL